MAPSLSLHDPWAKLFPNTLSLVLILFGLLAALRVYGYFGHEFFSGHPVMLGFVLMWFVPFIFFTKDSREKMGLRKPRSTLWTIVFIFVGAAFALLCYYLGILLYGKSGENWFVSVGYTFLSDQRIAQMPRDVAFLAFTIPAIIASPIGEEFFFRGVIHQVVEERWTWGIAAVANATLFALVHLLHHGIYRGLDGIETMPISGAIWFVLMFIASLIFTIARRKSGSIWASVLAHSGFNLVMNFTIFYSLFVS